MLLQPRRQRSEVGVEGLRALDVASAEVNVEVFVNVYSPVVGRVVDLVEIVRARQVVTTVVLGPRVATSPRVAWHDDQVFGPSLTDGIHSSLVVL